MQTDWQTLSGDLSGILGLEAPPVGLAFVDRAPDNVTGFPGSMSEPTTDGRSGRVPASCVFWMQAAESSFSTVAADHGNCSVGRWVHGFASPADIIDKQDVRALLESGWVSMEAIGSISAVAESSDLILYGPLSAGAFEPDVVMLRLTPDQMMQFGDACTSVEYSGKPQCQIVAKAKEHATVAASMGCALSRVRTGMSDSELTCAVPAELLPAIVERLRQVERADSSVRSYAAAGLSPTG